MALPQGFKDWWQGSKTWQKVMLVVFAWPVIAAIALWPRFRAWWGPSKTWQKIAVVAVLGVVTIAAATTPDATATNQTADQQTSTTTVATTAPASASDTTTTTTTLPATTTTTRATTTTVQPPATTLAGVDMKDLYLLLVRDESAGYDELTFVDISSDSDLLELYDAMCDLQDAGGTMDMAILGYVSGWPDIDETNAAMAGYVIGVAWEGCTLQ